MRLQLVFPLSTGALLNKTKFTGRISNGARLEMVPRKKPPASVVSLQKDTNCGMAQFLAFSGGVCLAGLGTVLAHSAVWNRVEVATDAINRIERDVPGLRATQKVRVVKFLHALLRGASHGVPCN
jgi:hypothetical protein